MASLPPTEAPQAAPVPETFAVPRRKALARRVGRLVVFGVWVVFIVFLGIILALRYAILPNIDRYRPDLEQFASRVLHQNVTIGAVSSSWQGLRPRLALSAFEAHDAQGNVTLRLPEVDATLGWESLFIGQLRLHSLEFGAPDLEVRRDTNSHLFVGGLPVEISGDSNSGFADWLLAQDQIIIRHAHLTWRDQLREAPDLSIDDIGVIFERFGTRHRFAITGRPAQELAAPLDVRGFFDHELFAPATDVTRWSGEIYIGLEYVDLAAWRPYLDYPFELTRGTGALRAWLQFAPLEEHNGRATRQPELTADVRLNDVVARSAPGLPVLDIASVDGHISLRETTAGDEFVLKDFSVIAGDGLDLQTTNLLARRSFDAKGAVSGGSLRADRVDLETLAALLRRFPLSRAAREPLDSLNPKGELQHLTLDWRGAPDKPRSYEMACDLVGLSVTNIGLKPAGAASDQTGFSNLTGRIHATEHGGTLALESKNAALNLPGIFDSPQLPLTRLEGEVTWSLSGDDLEVHVPSLSFENADASGTAQATYRRGPSSGSTGPGYLDLSGRLNRVVGTRVVAYLPSSMPQDVKRYVEHAVLSGTSDSTTFTVRGGLERFPFHDMTPGLGRASVKPAAAHAVLAATTAPDQFRIEAHLRGVNLDYAPRYDTPPGGASLWPILTLPEATLAVDEDRMEISAPVVKVYGYTLTGVRAVLPDLDDHNQVMTVRGEGSGPLSDLFRFVNNSPVSGWTGHFTENAAATGNARLALTLNLPFAHTDDTKVTGSIQMQGNDLTLFTWLPPLARTTGRFDFTENGIGLTDVSGDILGGTLKLSGATHEDHVIEINGEGGFSAAALKTLHESPALARFGERLDGNARYTLAVHVPGRSLDEKSAAARQPRVVLQSTLAGLAIDLPEPLKKPAADVEALRVELEAPQGHGREASDHINVRLGSIVQVVVERRADERGEFQMTRVAYGVNEAATLNEAHGYLNLSAKSLDGDAWRRTLEHITGENASAPVGAAAAPGAPGAPAVASPSMFLPEVVNARVDALHLWNKEFTNVLAGAQRSAQGWQVNISSDQVAGRLAWRQGALTGSQQNRVTARLTRLIVPKDAARDVDTLLDSSPSDIPALDIVAENFELSGKKFGHLELLASNVNNAGRGEWRLEKLTLANPDGSLDARGTWGADGPTQGGPAHTRLSVTVNSGNVGGLLDRMGLPGTIAGGTAKLSGDINWRGSPLSIDYPTLAGDLHVEAAKGQFLKADPGVAKLLGVLSLQGVARRLTFDFSDIFDKGFQFDTIGADATISEGQLSTRDFGMKGASAVVAIEGSVDLAQETQDLHITLTPIVDPSAAALLLLATPPTALVTLFGSKLLSGPLSNLFKAEYNVTGPWAAPVFTKVDRRAVLSDPFSDNPPPASTPAPRSEAQPAASAVPNPA